MAGNSHLPPFLLNICFSKYLGINSPKACEKVRLSAGMCLRSCIRSCCLFLEGNTRRLINANPALPLSGPQRGSCLWLLHHPTKLCLPCPVYGLWLQGKGKEQDLVARALKPAVNRREQESFWYLSSSQSQLRNFLWQLRLRLGGLEHLAWRRMLKYAKVCKQ